MAIPPVTASALTTVYRGLQDVDRSAAALARNGTTGERQSAVVPLVDARLGQRQAEAGARMLRVADEMVGSLLDEFA